MPAPPAPATPALPPARACALALVAGLVARGVRHVVVCPGSRSAPLAYALADAERAGSLAVHVRTDERAAAFTALGAGRATGVPAAVVTTSGTAVANLVPAVLEASTAGVPLLLLTADRPHAMRGTWANQTTALQAGLLGAAVRRAVDLPVPPAGEEDAAAARWAAEAADAVDVARGLLPLRAAPGEAAQRPGPVHLDLALGDPLVPDADEDPAAVRAVPGPVPRRLAPPPRGGEVHALPLGPRTVVVAGDAPARTGWTARWLAEAGGWPLLAEPSSGARSGPCAVGPYRLLLDRPELGGRVERAVVVGRPTLSRPVARLLADPAVEVVQLVDHPDEPGPAPRPGLRRVVGTAVPEDVLATGTAGRWHADRALAPDAWLAAWRRAGALAAGALAEVLAAEEAADGPGAVGPSTAREVVAATAPGDLLVLAASTAVRDADLAGDPVEEPALDAQRTPSPPPLRVPDDVRLVLSGRGLAGIDGTLSGAVGAVLATGRPGRVLVGDLAALHDLAGLAVPPGERGRTTAWSVPPQLQVVVLDDDGGGIFDLLEHGGLARAVPGRAGDVERLFGTPTGVDLVALARGLGLPATRVHGTAELRAVLRAPEPGLSVVVVPADRSRLRELHARGREAVGAVLDADAAAVAAGGTAGGWQDPPP
ncbi:2-succinyl-5-enolpyruvyl-6-hydroxy-3-cyclohexene-1-carboxylic-acid synthase [Pseudokineococcus lusitanus]|uniref:2-succinyl-5-enolpyruvyl-6-hydroxy-3-cyclohexene-1-carboxylate synthase n=1 Tax=Pseudokineococcus lusitanus TaxID=763993 RepID=A0A3N1HLP2_9ACTN|nr:2-succinyl-5-enolpyruvyl-6-hydroxy-3-cyclohexene-1-carboxylic-acid synthase [Pseudokineococcus lusitanus]ROP43262.1 2-succinyl-5-enolpyruvyl-6-hydroxy-3-cyclohexene-1-carboxylate synthase [Pseudokineococcus lusitanus]